MANSDNVLTKLHDLLLYITPQLGKFPRDQKFLLADRIETKLLDVQGRCIRAYYSREKKMMRHCPPFHSLFALVGIAWLLPLPEVGATFGDSSPFVLDTRNFADSTPPFTVDTGAPDILANAGITDPGGSSFTLTMVMLQVADGANAPSTIMYTLQSAPVHGILTLGGGGPLAAGAMFTQADIDAGLLVYERAPGDALSDGLVFSVLDLGGQGLLSGTLFFDIAGLAAAAGPLFLVDTRNFLNSMQHTVHTDSRAYLGTDTVPGSLRQAIANAGPGDNTVDFDAALSGGTVTLGGTQLLIAKDLTIDGSGPSDGVTISGNNASRVFGITGPATVAIDRLTINGGNAAGDSGGGIRNGGANLTLTNVTLNGNSAASGGAVYSETDLAGLSTTLINSTLAGNTATTRGGALYNFDGRTVLTHCTITGNTAPAGEGSGVASYGNTFTETELAGTIVSANSSGDVDLVIETLNNSFISSGSNLIGTGDATADFTLPGDQVGVINPLLAPLGDYGGDTPTMPPLPGSLAIEGAVVTANTPSTDQRGNPRPSGPLPDIGAVEAGSLFLGTLADSDNDGIPDILEGPGGPYPQFIVGTDDSALDTDGDGDTDAEELANMTDLADPTDLLRIISFAKAAGFTPANPLFDVTFSSFPGLTYSLECDANLDFGAATVLGPLAPTDFTHSATILLDDSGRDYIRLRRE